MLGFDFGTLSCRVLAVDLDSGDCVFEAARDYTHGVISGRLTDTDVALAENWFLQDPADYIEALCALTRAAAEALGAESIAAIGTDFTNCTVVGLKDGRPLCEYAEYRNAPHAWVKLWKHHAAQPYAERIEQILRETETPWFAEYGENVSSEWFFPKLLSAYEEAPELFAACDTFLEAADYMVYFLTGRLVRNSATLGVNAFYSAERGFPDKVLLDRFSPGFGDAVYPKLAGEIVPVGSRAGRLSAEAAKLLGLSPTVVVSAGHGDSEVACAGLGVAESGTMLMVMGTSTCFQMIHEQKRAFPGVGAVVENGMLPELVAYESGQPAVGDAFSWYVDNMMPAAYARQAEERGLSALSYMNELAARLRPGESGLVSLDWFNGNRSVLMNYTLKSVFAGLSLETSPEGIFRSLIEATAFGARKILEGYEKAGIHIEKLIAVGGLPRKSPLTMQIYADVIGRPISAAELPNASALGACVCGAVAFRNERGTLAAFETEAARLVRRSDRVYLPEKRATAIYDALYGVFCTLHDFAGIHTDICNQLNGIQRASKLAFENSKFGGSQ